MRSIFLLCLLFYCISPVLSQNNTTWFRPDARWNYANSGLFGSNKEYLHYAGDTLVDGRPCVKIQAEQSSAMFGNCCSSELYIFSERNDSVFLQRNNEFRLLYDFTRSVGDTISYSDDFNFFNYAVLQHTGDTSIDHVLLRTQDWLFMRISPDNDPFFANTRFVERLGGEHLIFQTINIAPLSESYASLTCYSDEQIYPLNACLLPDPNYIPFELNQSVWSQSSALWCAEKGFHYFTNGFVQDNALGICSKLYRQEDYLANYPCPTASLQMLNSPPQYLGYLWQDAAEKKLYFIRKNPDFLFNDYCETADFPMDVPSLIYDFSLKIGDTAYWKPQPNVLSEIQDVQLNDGTLRKRFAFKEGFTEQYWIEGIGDQSGLFGAFQQTVTDIGCHLKCYKHSDSLQYNVVTIEYCDSIQFQSAIHDPAQLPTFGLYPNPAGSWLFIDLRNIPNLTGNLTFFDARGCIQHEIPISLCVEPIQIPDALPAGMYLLQVRDKRGNNYVRKFLRE